MDNIFLTSLTLPELKAVFRKEIENYFGSQASTLDSTNNKLFTIDEAANFLNLSKPTLYRLVSEKNIPHSKKGKRLYFSREKLTEWVESGEVRTQAQIKKEVKNG